MEEKIKIIRTWLAENAPKILNVSLREGASSADLDQLEEAVGKKLPADFRELYQFHNGLDEEENCGSLFYGMSFLSVEDIMDDYEFRKEDTDIVPLLKTDQAISNLNIFNPDWLCIGFDGSHGTLRIDLAPTDKGTYGQVIFVDEEYKIAFTVAKSVNELVDMYIADLKNGLYSLDADVLAEGHEFLMPDESIDIVNWFEIPKWEQFRPTSCGPSASRSSGSRRACQSREVGSSRVDLQACKLEYSIVSPK